MNVLVSLAQRFQRTPDGSIWTPGPFAFAFWERYLAVFEGVRVAARVLDVPAVAETWQRADGPGVVFAALPYFRGPLQYLKQSRRVRSALRAAFVPGDAVLFRAPCQSADCLEPMLRSLHYPYGVEVVGDPYEVFAPGSIRHPLRPFFRWYFPRRLRRQCAGACGAAYVTRHSLPQRYPCPLHESYFSDVELPPEAWVAQPRPPHVATRSLTLVTVGSLEQLYKGSDVLLDAVARCVRDGWDLRLHLVGDGQYRPALEAQSVALGIRDRVVFRGQLPAGASVRAVLDEADLFVLPSRTEGLPRALIEAMARGLPCLGSCVGGIPELLPEEDLVPPGDAPALAAKLAEVLADPQRRARMASRNLEKAGEYRPELLRQRMLAFYRHVREQTRLWSETNARATVLVHVTTVPQSLGFLRSQTRFLCEKGVEIHAVSSPGSSLERFGKEQQIATHAVAMARRITPLRDLLAVWRLHRILHRIRPHIVHGHTPKGGLLAMLAAWSLGVPVRIYHIHGLPLMTATGLRRRILRWSEKTACYFARQVLCVSASVRRAAVAEGLCPAEKIEVLHHGSIDGMDADKFDPARFTAEMRSMTRARYAIPADAVVVGFVGRIVRDKGIVELAEAWRTIRVEYPAAHLLLVGEAEPQDPIPADILEELRRDSRIHWASVVRDMPPLYAAMDLVVLPTYREGFPVVPLEAAAMELPVIATNIPGCVDAVVDGVTGSLVPPRDAAALSDALRRTIGDPERRREQGRAGRVRILRDYRPEDMSDFVNRKYRTLLDRYAPWPRPTFYQRRGKRLLDLALTIPALLLLTPLLLFVAALVRLRLGSPILFRQRRAGRGGQPFTIMKFRTMTEERDATGKRLPDTQRLTRLGRLLRATSIDELPELFQVLKGEMSLVGPRPLHVQYVPYYTPRERKRLHCLPGLTGWAQINGRNSLGWNERLALDVFYVESCSLALDLKILFATVWKVLRRADVHVDPTKVLRRLDVERAELKTKEQ